jgi:aminopeptidase N
MKKTLLFVFCLAAFLFQAQHPCSVNKKHAAQKIIAMNGKKKWSSPQISHELKYDLKFVHLDLEVQAYTKYIRGNAKSISRVSAASLDTFMVILAESLNIDSIYFNGVKHSFIRQDSMVKLKPLSVPSNGATFTTQVWYEGTPPFGGSALGDGFSSDKEWDYNQDVTWSLSESFVAYHWWPCKQQLTDKIDSSWVFITTDSTNMAGSNGLLTNVVTIGDKKRYEWKSHYPIDYYLISVAVSKYKEYNLYAKPLYLNDSILVQNFVYAAGFNTNNFNSQEKPQLDKIPGIIEFFSQYYGLYPFYKEKYGHCMAPIGGGMEHQTMSTMGIVYYFYINAHELAHQWWGDNVTCKSWGDIFMNEGFASYSEHLANQYLSPASFDSHLNNAHMSVMSEAGGSCYFTDTLNSDRIFDSRLTYDKGGAIIHSLRFVTNDDSLWFGTLRGFQKAYKNSTASVRDFMDYYHASTNIDAMQFFNQWYYGEGYPTFDVKFNYDMNKVYLKVTQTASMPQVTPFFKTPVEYRIFRTGLPDTIVRLMHDDAVEIYTLAITGKVNTIHVDPKNWIINQTVGPTRDLTLGVPETNLIEAYSQISVSPNPSSAAFNLTGVPAGEVSLFVTDITGRQLIRRDLGRDYTVDMANYSDGIYIFNLFGKDGKRLWSQKVVKQ